jgi:hypothetical protein
MRALLASLIFSMSAVISPAFLCAQLPDADKIQAAYDKAIDEKRKLENDPGYRNLTTKEITEKLQKIAGKTKEAIVGLPFTFHGEVVDIDEKDQVFVRVLELKDRKKEPSIITLEGPSKRKDQIKKGTVIQFKGKVCEYKQRGGGDMLFYVELTPKNSDMLLGEKNMPFLEILGYVGDESPIENRKLDAADDAQCIAFRFGLQQDKISILTAPQANKAMGQVEKPDRRLSVPRYEDAPKPKSDRLGFP